MLLPPFGKRISVLLEIFSDLIQNNVHQSCPRLHTCPGDVGSDEKLPAVFDIPERILRTHGLYGEDIKPGRCNLPCIQCVSQILFVYNGPSSQIQENAVFFSFSGNCLPGSDFPCAHLRAHGWK